MAFLEVHYQWSRIKQDFFFFPQVFQEFQNISGQDIVDAINECYDGYFQELLVAIGNVKILFYTVSYISINI